MEQAMERGSKPCSPPPSERGRTTPPRNRKHDHTTASSPSPPFTMVEVTFTPEIPHQDKVFTYPEKMHSPKNQSYVPLKEESDCKIVSLKQQPCELLTDKENVSETHEKMFPCKSVLKRAKEAAACTSGPQKDNRSVLQRGSPKLHRNTQMIKTTLNRNRSSSLPVICSNPQSAIRERKATQFQPDTQMNKEFASVTRVDEVPSETDVFSFDGKHDSYPENKDATSGSLCRSPLNLSKMTPSTSNDITDGKMSKKCQSSEECPGKALCLPEQSKPHSRIPISTCDAKGRRNTSRIPKMVQNRPLHSTECESKLINKITCAQSKNFPIQNVVGKEKPQNQFDKKDLHFFDSREKTGMKGESIVTKKFVGIKYDTQKTSEKSRKCDTNVMDEEETQGYKNKRETHISDFDKLNQTGSDDVQYYSPEKYMEVFPDNTFKGNLDYYHSQQIQDFDDEEKYNGLSHKKKTLQNGISLNRKISLTKDLTKPSTYSSIPVRSPTSIHSTEIIENIDQRSFETECISQVTEENQICLLNDTLEDNERKDIEANVMKTFRQ